MLPAREADATLAHRRKSPPPSCIGEGDRAGFVDSIDLDMKPAATGHRADHQLDAIAPRLRDVDRVLQPFACSIVVDYVSQRIRVDDADAFIRPIEPTHVARN